MLAGALVLAIARLGAVEPQADVRVRWEAPAGCPSERDVDALVRQRVGVRAVDVQASVIAGAEGFVGDVSITSATGTTQRQLVSPACETLVEAVVLLAVVATDPVPTIGSVATRMRGAADIPEPVGPPPLPTIEPTPVPPPAQPPPRPLANRPRTVWPRIAAFAIVGGGTLPGVDVGVRGAIGVATKWVHVDATALYLAPRRITRDDVQVTLDAWAAGLRVCPLVPLPTARLELPICAVVGVGQLRGRAEGQSLRDTSPRDQPWVTAAVAPELAVVVHPRVRIVGGLELGGTVVGPGFSVAPLGRVWAPRRWIARGHLGLEVRL